MKTSRVKPLIQLLAEHDWELNRRIIKNLSILYDDITDTFSPEDYVFPIGIKKFKRVENISRKELEGKDMTFELGVRHFADAKIFLKRGVFVPQYDTEMLVEIILNKKINNQIGLELFSGTGAIAIALNKAQPTLRMHAVEKNKRAIKLSNYNNMVNKTNVKFIKQDYRMFNVEKKYDFLVANPPYISIDDQRVSEWVKKNQPHEALYAKDNGLEHYKYIIQNKKNFVKKGGFILFEIGLGQEEYLVKLLKGNVQYNLHKDLSGLVRFIEIGV